MKRPMSGNHIPLKHTEWYLLADYSLREFFPEDEPKKGPIAGFPFHSMEKLQLSPECVERMDIILAGIVQEAREHFLRGREKFSVHLRIFCQRIMIDKEIKGGWGYFLVERSIDTFACDRTEPDHFIDVYLYQEGE